MSSPVIPVQGAEGTTVTVRIDAIKEAHVKDIEEAHATGDAWILARRNDLEVRVHALFCRAPMPLSDVPIPAPPLFPRLRADGQRPAPPGVTCGLHDP